MPGQSELATVGNIRSILGLMPEGLSVPAISERLGLGKTPVATYEPRARQAGLVWPCPERREEKQKRRKEASTFAGSEWTPYKSSQIPAVVYFINDFDCYWTKVQFLAAGRAFSDMKPNATSFERRTTQWAAPRVSR